jgi:hypothetical protein
MKMAYLLILSSSLLHAQILFENQAESRGAGYPYGDLVYGAGISFFDYNGDGLDDITLAGSNEFEFKFLKNIGGSFQLENLGIDNNDYHTKQVIWVDFDNDGDSDFFSASNHDISRLYRNEGNDIFTDVTLASGFPGVAYKVFGASWGDYNNDGHLDVFLSIRDDQFPNLLYKNNGDGTFTNVTIESGLETTGYYSFCAAFFDYNNDGFQDIVVANDKYDFTNLLYKNNGNGTFDNVSGVSGTGIEMDAMSTTIGDYDGDGWLDIYITNSFPAPPGEVEGNVFFRNNTDGTFSNVAVATGTQFNSNGWGAVFLDADNDANLDLYVSGEGDGTNGLLPSAFYKNNGDGTFSIPTNAGFEDDIKYSYSNAIGDVDNDGYPEIIVMNNNYENIFLWKNNTPQNGNWLKVKLEGVSSNRMGVGSWIELSAGGNVTYNYTLCGEGYLSQNSAYEFFGLGSNNIVDYVKVTWLSGAVDYIENININQAITIVEGSSPLSIEEDYFNLGQIYPNPAGDVIVLKQKYPENANVSFYDMAGRQIMSTTVSEEINPIYIHELSSGCYLVTIETEEKLVTKKIVIR